MLKKEKDSNEGWEDDTELDQKIGSLLSNYIEYIEESGIKSNSFRNDLSKLIKEKWEEEKDNPHFSQ